MAPEALSIEIWPIDRLVHYARNPRRNANDVGRVTKPLMRRLQRLENTLAWRERAVPVPSAAPQFEAYLASKGIFREGSESLAETTARAFGWTIPQLRLALMQLGSGQPLNV